MMNNSSDLLSAAHGLEPLFSVGTVAFGPVGWHLFLIGSIVAATFILASNCFVIFAVQRHSPLRTEANSYIASLAATDLIMGCMIMPMAAFYVLQGEWTFGRGLCHVWSSTNLLCSGVSILHLSIIAIDRVCAVSNPIEYGAKRSMTQVRLFIGLAWGCTLLSLTFPYWGIFDIGPYSDSMTLEGKMQCVLLRNPKFAIVNWLVLFCIPTFIIIGMYFRLYAITRGRLKVPDEMQILGDGTRDRPSIVSFKSIQTLVQCASCKVPLTAANLTRDARTEEGPLCLVCQSPHNLVLAARKSRQVLLVRKERRALLITGVIVLTFLVCWTPAFGIFLLLSVNPSMSLSFEWPLASMWLGYLNSACNPVIYAVLNRDFQEAFRKYVLRKR